jgi:hypothetical protein
MISPLVAATRRRYAVLDVAQSESGQGGDGMKPSALITALVVGVIGAAAVITNMWFWLLMAVAGVLFIMFAIAHPRTALLVWLLIAPVADAYATVTIPGVPDIMFGRVTVVVVSLALLIRVMLKGRPLAAFGAIELAMGILIAVMMLNLARSGNPISDFMENFDERVTPIVLFLAARNLWIRRIDLRNAAYILAVVGCYLALHGGYQYVAYGQSAPTAADERLTIHEGGDRVNESHLEEGRAVGPFSSAVEYGGVTAICLVSVLYLAMYRTRGPRRAVVIGLVPVIAAGIIMSSTRSAWIGGYLAVVVMMALDRRRKILVPVTLAVTVVGLAASMVFLSDDSALQERASSLEPVRARLLMYDAGLRLALKNPILGYGRGAPSRIAARKELYAAGDPNADLAAGQFHNVFLMTLVEWGIGALIAYVAVLVLIVKAAIRLRRRLTDQRDPAYHFAGLVIAASVVYVVQGLLVDIPPFLYLNGVFFVLAGLMFAQLDATEPLRALETMPVYGRPITLSRNDRVVQA